MCSHYLVQPAACTPAPGWKKGQVENQVGVGRTRFFTPRLRAECLDERNASLLDTCVAQAKAHRRPEERERTLREMSEAERPHPMPFAGPIEGAPQRAGHSAIVLEPVANTVSRSKACAVRFASDEDQEARGWRVSLRNKCR